MLPMLCLMAAFLFLTGFLANIWDKDGNYNEWIWWLWLQRYVDAYPCMPSGKRQHCGSSSIHPLLLYVPLQCLLQCAGSGYHPSVSDLTKNSSTVHIVEVKQLGIASVCILLVGTGLTFDNWVILNIWVLVNLATFVITGGINKCRNDKKQKINCCICLKYSQTSSHCQRRMFKTNKQS